MTPAQADSLPLIDKVAIVTGAGSGIGRATCLSLANAGASVVAAGRTKANLEAVVDEIVNNGGLASAHQADVTVAAEVKGLVNATEHGHGGLDIYFNNAGISPSGTVGDTSEKQWSACIDVNLTSVFLAAKHALPALQNKGGGSFLITAGTLGLRPSKEKAAYAAAKAGAISLMRSIALDYGRDHIRANAICPGMVATALTSHLSADELRQYYDRYQPLPGTIEPCDIAATVVFLASDLGRYITGQCIVVDAGQQAGTL